MTDIHARSADYLRCVTLVSQKHRTLYELEVYVLLLSVAAVVFFVYLRGEFDRLDRNTYQYSHDDSSFNHH